MRALLLFVTVLLPYLYHVNAFSPSVLTRPAPLTRSVVVPPMASAVLSMASGSDDTPDDEDDEEKKDHLKENITEKLDMDFTEDKSTPKEEEEEKVETVPTEVLPATTTTTTDQGKNAGELTPRKKTGVWGNFKEYVSPPDDGSNFRQRLAKLGLAAALSYGWVSNMSYSVTVSLAWYIFSKRTGMSPLAPGQWKGFLTIYAGFFIFNNLIRPIRVATAVAISPKFDRTIARIEKKLKVSKPVAVAVTVFLANVVGTLTAMAAGIFLASLFAGVPIWAK